MGAETADTERVMALPRVYLDQCHVSRMAKARMGRTDDPEELRLMSLLQTLVREGKIVCPFSFWHVVETVGFKRDVDAMCATAALLDELSRGFCLRNWVDVAEWERSGEGEASGLSILGQRTQCFPGEWGPGKAWRVTEGAALITGVGVVELLVAWLSEGGRPVGERFKQNQVSFFRKMLHEVSLEGQLSEGESWQRALANYADGLETRMPAVRDTSFEGLVAAGLVTVASLTKFGAEALRDTARRVREGDAVDVCHVGHLPHCTWFLTDGHVEELCRRWSAKVGTKVFRKAADLDEALRPLADRDASQWPQPEVLK